MLEDICDKAVVLEQKVHFIADALCALDEDVESHGAALFLRDIEREIGLIADTLNDFTSRNHATLCRDEPQDQPLAVRLPKSTG